MFGGMPDDPMQYDGADTPPWRKTIDKALLEMYEAATAADGDPAVLGDIVAVLHGVQATVKDEYKAVCDMLARAMGDTPEVSTPGGFVLEKKTGSPRKTWRHTDIGNDVARRLLQMNVDMDTGEVLRSPEELMLSMLEYAAPSYWRVKPLAQIGIVADDYCDLGEPTTNFVVRTM